MRAHTVSFVSNRVHVSDEKMFIDGRMKITIAAILFDQSYVREARARLPASFARPSAIRVISPLFQQ